MPFDVVIYRVSEKLLRGYSVVVVHLIDMVNPPEQEPNSSALILNSPPFTRSCQVLRQFQRVRSLERDRKRATRRVQIHR